MEETIVPKLAFGMLKEAEQIYKETGTFTAEVLENLHSLFGEALTLATELLEKCKIIEYQADNGLRNVFNIRFTEDINFCQCETFRLQVLESRHTLTCKHVLAVQLARITGDVKTEVVSGSHLVDFLNEQLTHIEEDGG
ncbi:hypothetical protein NQ315_012337 [Exocentrus adspersus]|uniref:SWIM-type domain-containing protein n=1 Tax=Exocentrus adspersus TaxID=1586481 RepID=A0AAV8V926_9CUCU|nr:hypothetical protein NQ315_012337 [Exocentrus adspersus]